MRIAILASSLLIIGVSASPLPDTRSQLFPKAMDPSLQANPVVAVNEQRVKRGQDSNSHARHNMADGVALDKKEKRDGDSEFPGLNYWGAIEVEDDENAGAEA